MNKDYIIINGELYHADELYHYGVKGMKWGYRKYQNEDGSLTNEGKQKLAFEVGHIEDRHDRSVLGSLFSMKTYSRKSEKLVNKIYKKTISKEERDALKNAWEEYESKSMFSRDKKTAKEKYDKLMKKTINKLASAQSGKGPAIRGKSTVEKILEEKITKRYR